MIERKASDAGPNLEEDEEWQDARGSGGEAPPEQEQEFHDDDHDREQGLSGEDESGKRGRVCPNCSTPSQPGEITCGQSGFTSSGKEKKRRRDENQGTDQMLNIQYEERWSDRGARSLRADRGQRLQKHFKRATSR
jgi:hypothetical protein